MKIKTNVLAAVSDLSDILADSDRPLNKDLASRIENSVRWCSQSEVYVADEDKTAIDLFYIGLNSEADAKRCGMGWLSVSILYPTPYALTTYITIEERYSIVEVLTRDDIVDSETGRPLDWPPMKTRWTPYVFGARIPNSGSNE